MKPDTATTGRPRLAAIDKRLMRAFEDFVVESPVRSFGVQALVTRAGTTRDAFYRRYASIGHFFVEVALNRYSLNPTQDTGSLAGDLLVIQREQVQMYTDPVAKGLLLLILDASADQPVTANAFASRFLKPRRDATVTVLDRAVSRGEIVAVSDIEYTLDHISGSFLLRASMPGTQPIDEAFAQKTVLSVLKDLGVDDPYADLDAAVSLLGNE
ncbi:TetR-like C-terminal domain-containing protein [Jonesiaceae bacterium BS-20]|uniref:TetR-like C-terminal domain-containing protein n=1 Tax=Jonesiaceae bacterium BS-20 TaxID=3120821 RepID=A0AAU7DT44_9MICO